MLATLLCLGSAWAGELIGFQLAGAKDLPDGGSLGPDVGAVLGLGPALKLHHYQPVVKDSVFLRSSFGVNVASGTDRMVWEDEAGIEREVAAHEARVAWTRLSTGPEVAVPTMGKTSPYLGASLGLGVVRVAHPYNSAGPEGNWPYLQETGVEGLGPGADVTKVQTTQLLPDASAWLGLRFLISDSVAIGLESGYTVCHVPAAGLNSRPFLFQVSRSEFGLNVFRLGAVLQMELPG